jgi:NAD(P) transhydrogenase subunit alpha
MIPIFDVLILAAEKSSVSNSGAMSVLLLTVFILAIFVGMEIITKIPPTLHTPLMSGSNAISGITVIGALLSLQFDYTNFAKTLGCLAVILATMNVVGGFLVTNRTLAMFRRKD